MKNVNNITVLTVHYGDTFWINNLLAQLEFVPEVTKVIIGTRMREVENIVKTSKAQIVKDDSSHNPHASWDHSEVLTILKKQKIETEFVLILDTDILGIENLLEHLALLPISPNMAVLAVDPKHRYLSHPCFMLIPSKIFTELDMLPRKYSFYEKRGQKNFLLDTGRSISFQLREKNVDVFLIHSQKWIRGLNWDYYWDIGLIHLGSSSFFDKLTSSRFMFKHYIKKDFSIWFVANFGSNFLEMKKTNLVVKYLISLKMSTINQLIKILISDIKKFW